MLRPSGKYWTQAWNPVTGCTPISAGCGHCYAQAYLRRFRKPTGVTLHPERLSQPAHWRKPRVVFVCNCGDLFHEDVPDEFIRDVMQTMVDSPVAHQYLLCTKRAERLVSLLDRMTHNALHWDAPLVQHALKHVWFGVTVESAEYAGRLADLAAIKHAGFRVWVSGEPRLDNVLLDALTFSPDWVTLGAETGPGARPCEPWWIDAHVDHCDLYGTPIWVKTHPLDPNPRREMPPELEAVFRG